MTFGYPIDCDFQLHNLSDPIIDETFQRSTHDVCILAGRRLPLAVEPFVEQLKVEASHPPNERPD